MPLITQLKRNCREAIYTAITVVNALVPKRRQLLIHTFPDVEDQGVIVLRWLAAHDTSQLPVVFLISGSESETRDRLRTIVGEYVDNISFIRNTTFAAIWQFWRSNTVFYTHGIYGSRKPPRGQVVINLWHGMPIKAIWKLARASRVPECTYVLSTSTRYSQVLIDASGFSSDKVRAIGTPRNDLLFAPGPKARRLVLELKAGVDRLGLFLPTYRETKVGYLTRDGDITANELLMSDAEILQLRQLLAATRTRMLVKPHPMSVFHGKDLEIDPYLRIISDKWLHEQGTVLYELLGQTDLLITDVSSVCIDYLPLNRPMLFYFPDIELYGRTRKFLFEPVKDWLPGKLCLSANELISALRETIAGADDWSHRRRALADDLNPHFKPDVTNRLFSEVLSNHRLWSSLGAQAPGGSISGKAASFK